jgi:hypothetical protein
VCRDLVEAMGGHLRLGDDPGSPLIALELPLAVGD